MTSRVEQSVVDALMYALRSGISALDKPDNLHRLRDLDDEQLRTCVVQLLKQTAAWTQDEVGVFVATRKKLNGRRR
jgi:hypothetical protein